MATGERASERGKKEEEEEERERASGREVRWEPWEERRKGRWFFLSLSLSLKRMLLTCLASPSLSTPQRQCQRQRRTHRNDLSVATDPSERLDVIRTRPKRTVVGGVCCLPRRRSEREGSARGGEARSRRDGGSVAIPLAQLAESERRKTDGDREEQQPTGGEGDERHGRAEMEDGREKGRERRSAGERGEVASGRRAIERGFPRPPVNPRAHPPPSLSP